jgi:putative ABC transport system substrate-binding protein
LRTFAAQGKPLGLELRYVTFGDAETIPLLVASAVRQGAQALMFENPPPLHIREHQKLLAEAARRHRIPVIVCSLPAAENGVLMAYGIDVIALNRVAATYVDRILRGASPSMLPMEQPRKFELHLNLGAARAIGLAFSPSLRVLADRVFE